MRTLQEGDLIFDFSSYEKYERFDCETLHGNKSDMKKVDFILESENKHIFLEVKDPDVPEAANVEKFKRALNDGSFVRELAGQYRDSLLFSMLRGSLTKPISYIVLLSMEKLDDALVLHKIDELKKAIPITHKRWKNDSAASCTILKLDKYKEVFGDGSVWRASDYEDQ